MQGDMLKDMQGMFFTRRKEVKMFEEIKKMIVQNLNLDSNEITEETNFKKDLGVDSLDLFELVSNAEDEFGIEISSEELESIETVGDFVKYIEDRKG